MTAATVKVFIAAASLPQPTYPEAGSWQQGFGVAVIGRSVTPAGLQHLLMAKGSRIGGAGA